jgi:hypothetical protein
MGQASPAVGLQKDSLDKTQSIKNPEKVGTTRSFFIFYFSLIFDPATRPP